ncbi:MAG TPA: MlaD family protein [Nitrospiraceae bacterium]|nr:MlaD family protein [Nitrospiraceae bacterium]
MERYGHLKWSQLKVGLVVSIALMMLIIAVMNMSHGLTFISREPELRALVDHTQGLKIGGPVRLNGVDVGNVRAIGIAKDSNNVEIVFSIQRPVLGHLHQDASVNIRPLGLLGDKFLDLSPGSASAPPLPVGQILLGQAEADITGLASGAGTTLEHLNAAIGDLQRILAKIGEGQGTAGKLLSDADLYERSQRVMEKLETASEKSIEVLSKVERGEGTLGRLVSSEEFYRRAYRALDDLSQLAGRLNNQNGTLAKLSDPALYRRLDDLTARGEQLLNKIQHGEGTIGKLVNQDELYTRADKLLTELETLVVDVKVHPMKYFKLSLF